MRPSWLELALHHVLGGDTGVVHAGQPQHLEPLHPLAADDDVVNEVVEGMAHVEHTR